MDKTKEYLALMQKHHFWVICGVVLLASLISWYIAESNLDKQFEEQKALVDGKFTSMEGIAKTPDHPNDVVTKALHAKVLGIADNVYEAWKLRFEEQQKVPQWQGNLSPGFMNFITKHGPEEPIPLLFREEYMNFIKTEIEKLFDQVDARNLVEIENPMNLGPIPVPTGRPSVGRPGVRPGLPLRPGLPGRAGMPGGADQAMIGVTHEWKGLVAWDETLRQALRDQYFWDSIPTSLQVRFANEDLWIYRALLDIIRKTNLQPDGKTPIKEHLLAHVKEIEGLYIGPLVQPPAQVIFVPPLAAAALSGEGGEGEGGEGVSADAMPGAEGGVAGGLPAPPAMPGQGGEMSEGGEAAAGPALTQDEYTDAVLRHGRYVDAHGMPVGYNQPAPFAEFKIMPFEMRLVMDQRKIPDLLSNCANSPLPVEVQQVSIVSTETPPANVGGSDEGRSGMRGGMPGMPGMQGGMNRPMMNRGMMDGEGGLPGGMPGMGRPGVAREPRSRMGEGGDGPTDLGSALELRPFDLHVEVRGVIYIFNYPDRSKVGKAEPAPDVHSDDAAEATDAAEAGAGG